MSFSETKNNMSNQNLNNSANNTVKKVKSFYYNDKTRSENVVAETKPAEKTVGRSHFYDNNSAAPSFFSDDFLKSDKKDICTEKDSEKASLTNKQEIKAHEVISEKNEDPSIIRNRTVLVSLRAADISKASPVKKTSSDILRKIVLAFLLLVIVVSALNIVYELHLKKLASNYYDGIRESFYSSELSTKQAGYLTRDEVPLIEERLYSDEGDIYKPVEVEALDMQGKFEKMLPNIVALKKINSGVFAWIKVEGTRVDYPVVRSPQGNNDYYLDHALDRTYNVSGSVFTDYNNSTNLSKNRNTCVYGHNMNDGTMFQTIMNFKTKNQFDTGTIEMYTADGIHIYTPISAYEAVPTEMFFYTQFADDSHFQIFLDDIISKSIYTPPVIPDVNDKIITLITCTNTFPDKRFVVHGVLKEIIK